MANDVTIDLRLLTKKFLKDTKAVERAMLGFKNKLKQVSDAAKKMLLIGGAAIGGFIKLASDFEENLSKFNAVFKENAKDVEEWAKTYSASVNRSRVDTMQFLATLQDTFVPLGFARDKAAELSKQVVALAVDLASFNNESDATVVASLTSALVGNTEAVRKYGIVLNQASIDQELLNQGIKGGTKNASQAEKAFAIYNILLNSTKDAQGDAARTAGSFANQLKGLIAAGKELGIELGNVFLPSVTKMVKTIKESIPGMIDWVKINGDAILSFTKLAATVGAGTIIFSKIVDVLAPLTIAGVTIAANWATVSGVLVAVAGAVGGVAIAIGAALPLISALVLLIVESRNEIAELEKAMKLSQVTTENSAKAWKDLADARRKYNETSDLKDRETTAKTQVQSLETLLDLRKKENEAMKKMANVPAEVYANQNREIEQISAALVKAKGNYDRAREARIAGERKARQGPAAEPEKEATDEQKKLKETVDETIASLREQNDTVGMTADQIQIYQLRQKGVADEDIKQVQRLQALLQKRKELEQSLEDELDLKFAIAKEESKAMAEIQKANAEEFERAKQEDERRKKKAEEQKAARIETLDSAYQRILATSAGRTDVGSQEKQQKANDEKKIQLMNQFKGLMDLMLGNFQKLNENFPASPVTP